MPDFAARLVFETARAWNFMAPPTSPRKRPKLSSTPLTLLFSAEEESMARSIALVALRSSRNAGALSRRSNTYRPAKLSSLPVADFPRRTSFTPWDRSTRSAIKTRPKPWPVATASPSASPTITGFTRLRFRQSRPAAYGYPVHEAAEIAIGTIVQVLPPCAHVQKVRFVLFEVSTCNAFIHAAEKHARLNKSAIFEKVPHEKRN